MEAGLALDGLAYSTYSVREGRTVAKPMLYEDFLPRSAAGIFQSNLWHRGAQGQRGRPAGRAHRRRVPGAGRRPHLLRADHAGVALTALQDVAKSLYADGVIPDWVRALN
jgi:hypothetical protein